MAPCAGVRSAALWSSFGSDNQASIWPPATGLARTVVRLNESERDRDGSADFDVPTRTLVALTVAARSRSEVRWCLPPWWSSRVGEPALLVQPIGIYELSAIRLVLQAVAHVVIVVLRGAAVPDSAAHSPSRAPSDRSEEQRGAAQRLPIRPSAAARSASSRSTSGSCT